MTGNSIFLQQAEKLYSHKHAANTKTWKSKNNLNKTFLSLLNIILLSLSNYIYIANLYEGIF